MGSLINNLTNEPFDPFDLQNENRKYAMNNLNITFPYSFAFDLVELNWYDMLFFIDNGYLSHQAAIEHAQYELGVDDNNEQYVIELAILTPSESLYPHSLHPFIGNLANAVPNKDRDTSKQKLLYLVLEWVYRNRETFEDPLQVVEIIYADFGYPKGIVSFVRYMPMTVDEISLEPDIETRWSIFLEKQKILFGKRRTSYD